MLKEKEMEIGYLLEQCVEGIEKAKAVNMSLLQSIEVGVYNNEETYSPCFCVIDDLLFALESNIHTIEVLLEGNNGAVHSNSYRQAKKRKPKYRQQIYRKIRQESSERFR